MPFTCSRIFLVGFGFLSGLVGPHGWSIGAEAAMPPHGDEASVILVDGSDNGRIFDGIGALSAGASSRLLIDYPEPQRSEILDYLFKPGFGAALQINKVEIGGDMNSTDGAEPSHMRTPEDESYRRGYEWWLMVESKKRNPSVKLWGLEWGAPHWINPEKNSVYTQNNVQYIAKWVQHAKSDYGLDIDYLGGWNERAFDAEWYMLFRAGLNAAGLSAVKVVSDDAFDWNVGRGMKKDPAFAAAFEIAGSHYTGANPSPKAKEGWQACVDSGKPLWASEIGSGSYNGGAPALAKLYNQGYIGSKITSFVNWSTVWSVLPGLPYSGCGLMLADQPWSGHYVVGLSIWATAHTTQFTQPGWHYLDRACMLFADGTNVRGSCVALCSPDRKDFSIVIETVDANAPRSATFALAGRLPSGSLHVWKTNLRGKSDQWFVQQPDLAPAAGRVTLTFEPGCVYTISTVAAAHKGTTTPPAGTMLPLPYREDFQSYEIGATPKYISDQHGAFEVAKAGGGRNGKCLCQTITAKPVHWNTDADPATIVGDPRWRNYRASVEALLQQAGYVELIGCIGSTSRQNVIPGYHLRLDDRGRWSLRLVATMESKTDNHDPEGTEIAAGELTAAAGTGRWHLLSLNFEKARIQPAIDGTNVGSPIENREFKGGLVGLATSRWSTSEFVNLSVIPNDPQIAAQALGHGLAKDGAKVIACDSQDPNNPASNAIDGNPDTFWHTVWQPRPAPFPHFIVVDLGKSQRLRGIAILSRQDLNNGHPAECEVFLSDSPSQWGKPVASEKLADINEFQSVVFGAQSAGRYLKISVNSSLRNQPHTSIAELQVLQ